MKYKTDNPCFQCGKQRIISKTWTETITTFSGKLQKVTYTDAICPDAECQSLLDIELRKQKEKREKIAEQRKQRIEEQKIKFSRREKIV